MSEQVELAEKGWWNQYANLEDRIWHHNRFLKWVVRGSYLKEMESFLYRPAGRILDLGCGDAWVSLPLAQKGMTLDGLDLAEAQIELAQRRGRALNLTNAHFWCANVADLPKGTVYDGIILHAVLHHLSQSRRQELLHQLNQLLAPQGRLYMYEPLAALLPQPLMARFLDRGIGILLRSLKWVTRTLRLTELDIRLAIEEGWTMRSPNEAPVPLTQIEAELPAGLKIAHLRYWNVFSIAYANFCMELKPIWQMLFSPGAILFYWLDRIIFVLGIGQHLNSWPMAAIMIEKKDESKKER